jgi:hypothetical protein
MSSPLAEIGDVWRFERPLWDSSNRYPIHFLITDRREGTGRYQYLYTAIDLRTNEIVNDLLIDSSNLKNYKAHKVI